MSLFILRCSDKARRRILSYEAQFTTAFRTIKLLWCQTQATETVELILQPGYMMLLILLFSLVLYNVYKITLL